MPPNSSGEELNIGAQACIGRAEHTDPYRRPPDLNARTFVQLEPKRGHQQQAPQFLLRRETPVYTRNTGNGDLFVVCAASWAQGIFKPYTWNMDHTSAVFETHLPLPGRIQGKGRDVYRVERSDEPDQLLIIATDRISAYDVILPTPIPGKGKLLTEVSLSWFDFIRPTGYCCRPPDLHGPQRCTWSQ